LPRPRGKNIQQKERKKKGKWDKKELCCLRFGLKRKKKNKNIMETVSKTMY